MLSIYLFMWYWYFFSILNIIVSRPHYFCWYLLIGLIFFLGFKITLLTSVFRRLRVGSRMVVTRGWRWGNCGNVGWRVKTCNKKMTGFERCRAQPGDYNQWHWTVFFKVAKTPDLQCLTTEKEMTIMWRYRSVNYGGNHITVYKCIKSTTVHRKLTQYYVNYVLRIIIIFKKQERRGRGSRGQISWKINGFYSFTFEEFIWMATRSPNSPYNHISLIKSKLQLWK